MLEDLMRALVIGFAIAAAIGPIGVLCIRKSIQVGFWGGLTCGLGAAVADGIYGTVAAFGLVAVDSLSGGAGLVGRLLGGIILIYMGVCIYRSKISSNAEAGGLKYHAQGFGAVLMLTLCNPMTIVAFLAIFAGLGVTIGSALGDKITLIAGIFLGSALWWVVLAGAASWMRERLNAKRLNYINGVSGMVIGGFGGFSLISAAYISYI